MTDYHVEKGGVFDGGKWWIYEKKRGQVLFLITLNKYS